MPVAVEEFLRFYAPVTMARLVAEDHEFFGSPMKKDDWVLLGFPAANRDPKVFADATSSSSTARRIVTRPSDSVSIVASGRTSRAWSCASPSKSSSSAFRDLSSPTVTRSRGLRARCADRDTSRCGSCPSRYSPRFGLASLHSFAIHASTSSASRGNAAERFCDPVAVTSTSSSMRTPTPRYSSGTVRSLAWKYSPGPR